MGSRAQTVKAPIRFYATQPHYAAHLLPIFEELRRRHVLTHLWTSSDGVPDDGTPTVIAGQADIAMIPGSCPIALVSHGVDQTYRDVDHGSYAGGRNRERVSLFLCPSQRSADTNLGRYPSARTAVIGSIRADALASGFRRKDFQPDVTPTVLLAWHWELGICPETRSAWSYYAPVIERLRDEFRFLGHCHPRDAERFEVIYRELGIESAPDLHMALREADLFVADNTSALYEVASLNLPVLTLDAPWYRDQPRHGLRFYDQVPGLRLRAYRDQAPECGVVYPHWGRDVLGEAIRMALLDFEETAEERRRVVAHVYDGLTDGKAASRAADVLAGWT